MALTAKNQQRADSFGDVAEAYERLRPGYPDAVFDEIADRAGERLTRRVLDVGAGGGRATLPLAHRGAHVVALEPAAGMANVLQARVEKEQPSGHVDVRIARFEELSSSDGPFAVVVSAQAFHWTDPNTRWRRLADLLEVGGVAFLFWNGWSLDGAEHDLEAVSRVYAGADGLVPDLVDLRSSGSWVETEIAAESRLSAPESVGFDWDLTLTIDDYLGLLGTTSQYVVVAAAVRQGVFAGLREVLGAQVSLVGRTLLLATVRTR